MSIRLSALKLRDSLVRGELSVKELVQDYLDRITELDPHLDAFNSVFAERSIDKARELDKLQGADVNRYPLFGLPIAVKDNLCTSYGHTTCSSRILADFRAPYTATAVARLEDAGAVIIGKANMDEFAMGSSTENSAFKTTRNPWNPAHVPGGSSGGPAAAVSAGLCAAALGSDTGGSIRQPAAFCGIVGLKPTYGRVSRYGLVAYGSSLDQVGPLARDTTDCALLAGVIAGYDPADSTSVNVDVPGYLSSINEPPANLTIGLPVEFYTDALNSEIRKSLEDASSIFSSLGAKIVQVHLPHSRIDMNGSGELSSYAVACYYIIAMAEASSNLSRYDGVHYGYRTDAKVEDIVDLYSKSRSEGFGEEVKRRIMLGTYTLSGGYYDAYYLKALKVRRLIKSDFDRAFKDCDILLCPVSPTTAFRLGEKTLDPLNMYLQDIYTLSLNLSGLPGLSLPCGISKSRLPIGMQLIGPVFSEEKLFRAARMFERETGLSRLDPYKINGDKVNCEEGS